MSTQRKSNPRGPDTSALFADEPVLIFHPSLACLLGLNEAIVLQQLHYWLKRSENEHEGHRWVYNTYKQWREKSFPFWEERTIQRAMINLEGKGLVISCRLQAQDWNQRKWYRIDYDALYQLFQDNAA
jgi:hypothetical protein